MVDFLNFPRDIQDLMIQLPYRVGVWVSMADRTGGGQADSFEKEALAGILSMYAEDYPKAQFVQNLMGETLARRSEWGAWDTKIDSVPIECEHVLLALLEQASSQDIEAFSKALLDIGVAVAMAYCESKADSKHGGGVLSGMTQALRILFGGFKTVTADENISVSEHRALVRLAKVLNIKSNILGSAA